MIQQRPVMTREELQDAIRLSLIEAVPGNRVNGPDSSALMKAQVSLSQIMQLVDSYVASKR